MAHRKELGQSGHSCAGFVYKNGFACELIQYWYRCTCSCTGTGTVPVRYGTCTCTVLAIIGALIEARKMAIEEALQGEPDSGFEFHVEEASRAL